MNGHYTYNFLASKKKPKMTGKDKIRTMTMINVVSTGHRRHMHDINIIKTYGDTLCDFVVKNYYTILKNLES